MGCPWSERRHVLPTASTRCLVATLFTTGLVLWMSVLFAGGSGANPEVFDERASQPAAESLAKAPPRPEITSDDDHVDASAFPSGDTGGDEDGPLIAGRSFALPRDTTGFPDPAHRTTHAITWTATAILGSRAHQRPKVLDSATSMTMPARHSMADTIGGSSGAQHVPTPVHSVP